MATYRTTKCPYCGFVLQFMSRSGKRRIGPPTKTCPSCNKQYKTGMKYWKDMDGNEKFEYYFIELVRMVSAIVIMPLLALFLLSISSKIFDFSLDLFFKDYTNYLILAVILIAILTTIVSVKEIKKEINYTGED